MKYRVVHFDDCAWHEPEAREMTPFAVDEDVALAVADAWLSHYHFDIVMLVEVTIEG